MRISKVILNNFKNLRHLKLDLTQNHEVTAPNGYGKSSIADAVSWVLTGKLYSGSSDHMSIKPKDDPSALVEVELKFDDGLSLKKTYQEKWTRTRGTNETTLTGHETNCYIDGLPVPVTKYDDQLNELFKIDFKGKWNGNLIQLLIDPTYFGLKLDWKDRRTIVIDLVGDVTDADVFTKDPTLKALEPHLLKARGKFEDVKKILNHNLKELRAEETKLGHQIEALEQVQTVSKKQFDDALDKLQAIDGQIDELKQKKYQDEKDLVAERRNKLAELQEKINESKENDLRIYNETFAKRQQEIETLKNQKEVLEGTLTGINNEITTLNLQVMSKTTNRDNWVNHLKRLEATRDELRNEFVKVRDEEFHTHDHLECPNCGHDLNADLVSEQKEKFEKSKEERKQQINLKGGEIAKEIIEVQNLIVSLNTEIDELTEKQEALKNDVPKLIEKINEQTTEIIELSQSIPPFTPSEETQEIAKGYEELKASPMVTGGIDYSAQIDELVKSKEPLQEVINTYRAEQVNIKRALELTNQLDEVVNHIAEQEHLGALLSEFIKVKLSLLNERVEAVFGDIKFQLVESNIKEGSWNEVCYVLDGEVPYHDTNSAEKIRLGIKVAEAIRKHLSINGLPYIIDNAEQITDRNFNKLTNEQTISFIAHDAEDVQSLIKERQPDDMEQTLFTV